SSASSNSSSGTQAATGTISNGGSGAISLVDPSAMQVVVSVDESDVAKVSPGQDAQINVEAAGQRPYPAKVVAIAPQATVQSGVTTYEVSLNIPQPAGLRAGMTAQANIVYQS